MTAIVCTAIISVAVLIGLIAGLRSNERCQERDLQDHAKKSVEALRAEMLDRLKVIDANAQSPVADLQHRLAKLEKKVGLG